MSDFVNLYGVRIKLDSITQYNPFGKTYVEVLLECGKLITIECCSEVNQRRALLVLDCNI